MRAALLEEAGKPLRVVHDVHIAPPRVNEVRVAIRHCGLCHSDLSIVDGAFPAAMPIVLGHEAAGIVAEIGPGVEHLAVGDHVVLTPCPPCGRCFWCARGETSACVNLGMLQTNTFADGTTGLSRAGATVYRGVGVGALAEHVVSPASGAIKIPDDVPLDIACVIGCAVQTGTGAVLNTAKVEEGATVLIMGLGAVGLAAVQGARLAGAACIIASDPIAERRDAARRFGATDVLDPNERDVLGATLERTGIGVDYAFEAAGRAALLQTGLAAARNGGTVVCLGAPPMHEALELGPAVLFTISQKRLLASVLGSCHPARDIPRFVALWRAGRLDLEGMVTARRPLAEINEAFDDLRRGRGVRTVVSI